MGNLVVLLTCAGLLAGEPLVRTAGVHLYTPGAPSLRWLGPGGQPVWSGDGPRLHLESHHDRLNAAPLGPLYTIDVRTAAARLWGGPGAFGCGQASPDGTRIAYLQGGSDGQGAVGVWQAADARLLSAPLRVGAITPRTRQSFAWDAAGLLWVTVPQGETSGLWQLPPAGAPQRVVTMAGLDGVWPGPNGLVAARLGQQLLVFQAAQPTAAPTFAYPAQPDCQVLGASWAGETIWIQTAEPDGPWAQQRRPNGEVVKGWPLAGPTESLVGWRDGQALYLARREGQTGLWQTALASGEHTLLATIDSRVPLRPSPDWLAPAPVAAPDGRSWATSLGRTDRFGIDDRDLVQTTAVNVAGKTCRVTRRGRNVGPSGVVFDSAAMAFAGRQRPRPDGRAIHDTRPGTMRWQRPSWPRWVVLHHTATQSDGGSLNALTSSSDGLLSKLYQDITPGAQVLPEPSTIGVHYLVLRAGTVLQLAEEQTITRHAGTGQWRNTGPIYDFNSETIGIEIVANGWDFTAGQIRSVGRLVADICRRQAIPLRHIPRESFVEGVVYHKDFAGGLRGKPDPAGWPWDQMKQHADAYLAGR
ncbi:MAG: N-acetylmuramoyl-L-alanine amidase [Fimbriimonadaceae bacterium]|nr:N-acetylmuramoyl-L-alanine amidase [Fimbriimonadaceae bacterium]